jgi:cytochrome bd ubiquinol oxidase subunit II
MEATALQITWFILFGVLIGGYAILDGFDLGVGINSLFVKKSDDRRLMINAIAPVWDGNEVWLVTGGGALFAAFPPVYATTFSGFYLAIMLLLPAMIVRAVSMEFRGKVDSAVWKRIWDFSFGLGSLVTTLLFGVAIGNVLRGIPLNANGDFTGTFLDLLNPISIATGILSVVMFSTQGALYMLFKSEGTLQDQMNRIAWRMWLVWGVLFIGVSAATLGTYAHISENALSSSYGWLACVAVFAGLVAMPIF